jgi:hypothetical protein
MDFKLRPYQEDLAQQGNIKLNELGLVYLSMEVRTGKTLTALSIADRYLKADKTIVLFVTKKKAISSIHHDYGLLKPKFELVVTNYESLHKVNITPCLIILDEAHKLGAFPKPSQATQKLKDRFNTLPMIFLSGTPSPESYSQLYHQFWVSGRTPFYAYKTFYDWAKHFVNITKKTFAHGVVNDYSDANNEMVQLHTRNYFLSYTQKKAGFETQVEETILEVDMLPITSSIIKKLEKDLVVNGKDDVILADTPVKLMQKVHQLSSGSCIAESGEVLLLDYSKANFIKSHFNDKKIAIFYKFKGELQLLKAVYKDYLTTDLEEFKATDKNIALQIVSGREGISLKEADCLVFFNIDFSAVSYWQSRDRLATKERVKNDIYWIFGKGGIEHKIFKTVKNKKDFTLSHYRNGNNK